MIEASVDLYAIRHERGGTVYDGGRRWVGPGPGHSRRDASLSVWVNNKGRPIVHSFAGDDWRDCLAHLGIDQSQVGTLNAAEARRAREEREAAGRAKRNAAWAFCRTVWNETGELAGSPAEAYLASRGLHGEFASDLRFHPAAPLSYERKATAPGLMALVRNVAGRPIGLHVTALKPDGSGKAAMLNPRRMFGTVHGGAVQLAPVEPGGGLAVAEGIETALSFAALHQQGCWACLSTSGMAALELPARIGRLYVAADGDEAGLTAARILAAKARRQCEAVVLWPGEGLDWNDALRGEQ